MFIGVCSPQIPAIDHQFDENKSVSSRLASNLVYHNAVESTLRTSSTHKYVKVDI